MSLAEYMHKTMLGARAFTYAEDPGPLPCSVCNGTSEAQWIDWQKRWFRVSICADCVHLQNVEEGRAYDQAQSDEWVQGALSNSGLHAAEIAYDSDWMDARMKNIHFAGDKLDEAEKGLPVWRYVHGRPGTGTTAQIALACRYYIVRRRKRCRLVSTQTMRESLRPGGTHTVQDYIDIPLLAIDKFGVGLGPSSAGAEALAHILDERRKRLKPTLIASTLPLASKEKVSLGEQRVRSVENDGKLRDLGVAAMIFGMCVDAQNHGARGILHMTTDHRKASAPNRPSTYQQRLGGGR